MTPDKRDELVARLEEAVEKWLDLDTNYIEWHGEATGLGLFYALTGVVEDMLKDTE